MSLAGSPHYRWVVVALLFFIAIINYADRTAFTAVFPLLQRDLGMSDVELSALGALFLWGYAVLSPLAGMAGDRFSRRRLILISLTAWSLVTIASGFVADTHQLLGLRLLLGASESFYMPAAVALIADHHPPATRGTAMGIQLAGFSLGTVVGATATGYAGPIYGWRVPIVALGGAGLVLALVALVLLFDGERRQPEPVAAKAGNWRAVREILRVPTFLLVAAEAMLISIGVWIFTNWLPLYFQETYAMSLGEAGFSGTALITAGVVAGLSLGGWLSDLVGRGGQSGRLRLHSLCDLLAVPFLIVFVAPAGFWMVGAAMFGFSFIRAVGQANAVPVIYEVLKPAERSTAIGLMNMANCLAGGAGVLLTGYLKRAWGLRDIFATVAGIVLLCSAVLWLAYRYFVRRDLARAPVGTPLTASIRQ